MSGLNCRKFWFFLGRGGGEVDIDGFFGFGRGWETVGFAFFVLGIVGG